MKVASNCILLVAKTEWCNKDLFHLSCSLTLFSVVVEVHSIVTVLQFVLGYPLRVIMSSLRCYTCHFNVLTTQINLQPLMEISVSRWPRSYFTMQSALLGGMISIELRRSTNLPIRNCTILHAESFLAFSRIYTNTTSIACLKYIFYELCSIKLLNKF